MLPQRGVAQGLGQGRGAGLPLRPLCVWSLWWQRQAVRGGRIKLWGGAASAPLHHLCTASRPELARVSQRKEGRLEWAANKEI